VENMMKSGGDGVVAKGVYDSPFGTEIKSNVYAVKNTNQIKSSDFITRDDEGNIIPLSQRFDSSNDDIRY
jgi:hypothetical protein